MLLATVTTGCQDRLLTFLKLITAGLESLLVEFAHDGVSYACTELDCWQGMIEILRRGAGTGDQQDIGLGSQSVFQGADKARISFFELGSFAQSTLKDLR